MLGGLAVGLVCLPGSRVTRENCERIKEGMTEAEVRAILGKPCDDSLLDPDPPDYGALKANFLWGFPQEEGLSKPAYACFWAGNNLIVLVYFDSDHLVLSGELFRDPDRPRTWLPERVWRRLRARYGW